MDTPAEIWLHIASYLPVNDKCSFLTTGRAIKQTLYNDSFWLDFALKNLLRGLTVKEIIVLVFLKADQERLSKSRISKIQKYLKIKYGTSIDIPAIINKEASKPSSEISFGSYNGISWREWGTYKFSCNFVALFCRPVKLTALKGDKEEIEMLWELHGTSITDLTYRNDSFGVNCDDLSKALPNLQKFKALAGEFKSSVLESMSQNMTRLHALTLDIDNGQLNMLTSMTNLTKLKDTSYCSYDEKEKLLRALGPNLKSLGLANMSKADMNSLAKHCKQLHSLRLTAEKEYPKKVFETLSKLAKSSAEFPKKLKLRRFQSRGIIGSLGFGEDSSFFFQNFGSRLLKLKLQYLAYSHVAHLVYATNLVELELKVIDEPSNKNGAANITVPHVIAQLSKLLELDLELATPHRINLTHPHLTKLQLRVADSIIDTPALVDLRVFKGVFGIKSCALKHLYFATPVTGLHEAMNVDWSALESLTVTMDNDTVPVFWLLVDKMPADVVLKKGCVTGDVDLPFRATKNQSLMPPTVKITQQQMMEPADVDYVAQPRELTLEGPPLDLRYYELLVAKFPSVECLDFYGCANITAEALDILCKGLPNLKQIGFTESRDVNAPFSHLKLHSKSLELIYLYHIHSVETSDIQCPNARTITFDNDGRYDLLNDVTNTNLCEATLQLIGETNSCPNLLNYSAYPTQTYPDGMYTLKRPTKPVKLTRVPSQLQFQRLYLNMNLVEVDFESDNLTEASFDGCLNLTRVKIKAPLRRFSTDAPLKSLFLESTLLKTLDICSQIEHIELYTPKLKELSIVCPITYDFFERLATLEELTVKEVQQKTYQTEDDENNANDGTDENNDKNRGRENESDQKFDAATLFAKLLSSCPQLTVLTWCCAKTPLLDEVQRKFETMHNKKLQVNHLSNKDINF